MPTPPTITDAEWDVMSVLWLAAPTPLTANEVVARLDNGRGWNPRTVKALLNRLLTKRAIAATAQGNRYLYRPRVGRDACVRGEAASFAARVFGDAVGPMLVQFVRAADLSPAEVAELRQALDEKHPPARSTPNPED